MAEVACFDWNYLPNAILFKNGLPKIHEHDNKPPQAFGLFWEGRLVCLYTYECDLGDGWEDADVHKDPEEVRLKALQMGANIIQFVFMDNTSKWIPYYYLDNLIIFLYFRCWGGSNFII